MGPRRYEIRARHGWLRDVWPSALMAAGFVVVCGGGVLLFGDDGDGGFGRVFLLAGIVVLALFFLIFQVVNAVRGDRPELVVEPPGVRLGGVRVPWASIRQIVVLGTGTGPPTGIGLRLRFGAPLPHGMDHVIYDREAPHALHCRHRLRGGPLDTARLDAAVRAFAPPGVRVVGEDPGRAEQRPRPPAGGGRRDAPATVLDVRMHDHSSTSSGWFTYKPYPVVGFTLPDGRQVIAETGRPGEGAPGAQVMVSYDPDDPADVYVHGGRPRSTRRLTEI